MNKFWSKPTTRINLEKELTILTLNRQLCEVELRETWFYFAHWLGDEHGFMIFSKLTHTVSEYKHEQVSIQYVLSCIYLLDRVSLRRDSRHTAQYNIHYIPD